ncbi:MAG: NAD(P)H-binding protein [Bacteroidetes bacterium]|nr:NAD(P)H-binding protein [Bacteroidota bacterium]
MNIVLTGSLGNIGKPLAQKLVQRGHMVTVISSNPERVAEIKALGARPAVGKMQDVDFLTDVFAGADIVYLMETLDAVGDMFDESVDFMGSISEVGKNYKMAIGRNGVKRVVHLSSVGADMEKDNGILLFHHNVEGILKQLPEDVAIKFIRPVGFYTNLFSYIREIKSRGVITCNYGGGRKHPWVAPSDIADVVGEEMEKPFDGRMVRYVASDEASANEVAAALGKAIGKPDLKWMVVSDEELLSGWLGIGFNSRLARGFVEMQASQGNGILYEDYYRNKPLLGKVKLADFAREFAAAYNQE